MILPGGEQREILDRAQNRTVMAMIDIYAPVEVGVAFKAGALQKSETDVVVWGNRAYFHTATVWEADDHCLTLVEKDPIVLAKAAATIRDRRKMVNNGEITDSDAVKAAFNSEDVITRATGIQPRLNYDFSETTKLGEMPSFETIPFDRLRGYLKNLHKKLVEIDAFLTSAAVEHSSSMTVFDYYEHGFQRLGFGRKFSYGDVMLSRGYNLLTDIGMPVITPPRKDLN
jgi:hypothetical protein